MRRYRAKKKTTATETESLERRRKSKKNTSDEKKGSAPPSGISNLSRKLAVLRTKNWRLRVQMRSSGEDLVTSPETSENLPTTPFSSRWSEYRAQKKAKSSLPQTPAKKAQIVHKLMESPQTKELLERKGAILTKSAKKQLQLSNIMLQSVSKALQATKAAGGSNKNAKAAHETLCQAAVGRISRKYRLSGKLHSLLHVRRRRIREEWWVPKKRKLRKDRIPERSLQIIEDWYMSTAIAREVPCKRAVHTVNKPGGTAQVLPTYVMTLTMQEAFQLFKGEHPDIKVGYTSFRKFKPKQVRRISEVNRRTCLCQVCCNLALKVDTLKKLRAASVLSNLPFSSKKDLSDKSLCPYDVNPASNCLNRDCKQCGVEFLGKYYDKELKENKDLLVKWSRWEYITIAPEAAQDDGKKKRVLSCVNKETTLSCFLQEIEKDLGSFPKHLFEAQWQQNQMNACIKNWVTCTDVAAVMDYSENYRISYQNEVQSAFFDPIQVTIHPMMFFYKNKEDILVKHAIIGISNDPKHDASGVKAFEKAAVHCLKSKHNLNITSLHQWSDGCAGQYKGKFAFADISSSSLPVTRNFFVTSHGKNVCDGLGAVVKNMAMRYVMGHNIIGNASDLYKFCLNKVAHEAKSGQKIDEQYVSIREFVFVEASTVDRQRPDVQTLPGTRKLHAVANTRGRDFMLHIRNLSCYCVQCIRGASDLCRNKQVDKLELGSFVAVRLGNCGTRRKNAVATIFMAEVLEVDEDLGEILVKFMQKTSTGVLYTWPEIDDLSYQPIEDVVGVMTPPTLANEREQFRFEQKEIDFVKTSAQSVNLK